MAKARVYRHDIRCPHCGSNWCIKYGHANGKQTYRCNDCLHRFTPQATRHAYPNHIKQEAIRMYCEGMSVSSISRALQVKTGTIYAWIKKSPVGVKSSGKEERRVEISKGR